MEYINALSSTNILFGIAKIGAHAAAYFRDTLLWGIYAAMHIFYVTFSRASNAASLPFIIIYTVLAVIFGVAVIYLRSPFWCRSPVFHRYDFWRYMYFSPFVIQSGSATKTKFVLTDAISTVRYAEMPEPDADAMARLLQGHYIHSDGVFGDITPTVLRSEMSSIAAPSFASLYYAPFGGDDAPLMACMTSRPVSLFFALTGGGVVRIPSYLLDHICTLDLDPNLTVGRSLFHTHEYNQRAAVPEIKMSLFRREGALCSGVVPLVEYRSCTFRIPNARPPSLPQGVRLTPVSPQSRSDITGAIESATALSGGGKMTAIAGDDMVFELLRSKILVAFCLKLGNTVLAVYFFRDLRRQSDVLGGGVVALVASICNTRSSELFFDGFMRAVRELQKGRRKFAAITVDSIGNNISLCLRLRALDAPVAEVACAYYLYNGAHPQSPLPAESCFMLM